MCNSRFSHRFIMTVFLLQLNFLHSGKAWTHLKEEGPSLDELDAMEAIQMWFSQGKGWRRPNNRCWPSEPSKMKRYFIDRQGEITCLHSLYITYYTQVRNRHTCTGSATGPIHTLMERCQSAQEHLGSAQVVNWHLLLSPHWTIATHLSIQMM